MASTVVDAPSEVWAERSNGRAAHPDARAQSELTDLFEEHGKLVLGICRMLLRNREESEDAAQQTFLSAYRSLLRGGQPRQPAAWLAAIARNECSTRIRQRMRAPLADSDIEGEQPDHVPDVIRSSELWQAIGELPSQQRRALLLREIGLTYGEMATELNVSEPAVESLLFRARTQLRGALACVNGVWAIEAIRQLVARGAAGGAAGAPAAAKLAAMPLAAKLAAGGVAVTIAAGGAVALKPHSAPAHKAPAAKSAPLAATHPAGPAAVARAAALLPPVPDAAPARRPKHAADVPKRTAPVERAAAKPRPSPAPRHVQPQSAPAAGALPVATPSPAAAAPAPAQSVPTSDPAPVAGGLDEHGLPIPADDATLPAHDAHGQPPGGGGDPAPTDPVDPHDPHGGTTPADPPPTPSPPGHPGKHL